MNFWEWIKAYWFGFSVVVATPQKHYKLKWLRGRVNMTTEIPQIRGISYEYLYADEEAIP